MGCNAHGFGPNGLELWCVTAPFQPPRGWGAHYWHLHVPIDDIYWMARRGVPRLRAVFPAFKNSYVRFRGTLPHLDSILAVHHDASMRTTVTLDKDVERLLREAMHRSRRGFKETLNAALRTGLTRKSAGTKRPPFVVHARPMGLRPGLDPAGLNKLADELELEAFLAKTPRPKAR